MSSFNLAELSSPLKENISFPKYSKKSIIKADKNLQEFKENSNKPPYNKTYSQEFSIDFLESIEKCLRNSFSACENDNLHNILSNKKNSYFPANTNEKDYFEDKDFLNNLDSLIHKSNNVVQDSIINKLLDGKSFEGDSPSLNHENDFAKENERKFDQNDTYLYQIDQFLKNFEEDEEKNDKNKKNEVKVEEKMIENVKEKSGTLKNEEHIMIMSYNDVNEKKKKKKNVKCVLF